MTKEFENYKRLVTRKRKHLDKLHRELHDILQECTHEELIPKSSYHSGDYYNGDYIDYWDECVVCGERFNQHI